MPYKDAFQCTKCPRSNDPEAERACPAWWEVQQRNSITEDYRTNKACAFVLLPHFLMDLGRMAHMAAETAVNSREEVLKEISNGRAALLSRWQSYIAAEPRRAEITGTVIASPEGTRTRLRDVEETGGGRGEHEPRLFGDYIGPTDFDAVDAAS